MNRIFFNFFASTFSCVVFQVTSADAVVVSGVTYTYDNTGALADSNGFDNNYLSGTGNLDASRGGLTDGAGLASSYTPTNAFYTSPELGTIFLLSDGNIPTVPQPQITFDLGTPHDLTSVDIHYGVYNTTAVLNPSSVDVFVDGNPVGNFTGFVDSRTEANNTIHVNSIDLTGQTGQSIQLQLRGSSHHAVTSAWLGLTEVQFNAVPEPSTGMLLTCALGAIALRRRRKA